MPTRRATNLKVRDATAADAVEIEAVHQASREAAFRGRLPLDVINSMDQAERLERWHAWLADPAISTLVGIENGAIRGFCTLKAALDGDLDPHRVAEMPTLYVDPGSWRKGFGHDLCRAVEARAVELGFEELTLWVLEVNAGARRFYSAVGFRHDGATKMDDGPIPAPVLALRYRKTLRRAPV
jgi:ribosomal protein S18 acetylase RimI-like enzyme